MKKQTVFLLTIFLLLMIICLTACSHVHEYEPWTVETESSCAESGLQVRFCQCGQKDIRLVPRIAHTEGRWNTLMEPTCAADGLKQLHCAACGIVLQSVSIPAAEHTWGDWITTAEATCAADGIKYRPCSSCGMVLQVASSPAADHTPGDWITMAEATCASDGLKYQNCAECKILLRIETTPAEGHVEGTWIIDLEPSDTQEGFRHCACAVCGILLKSEHISVIPQYVVILDAGHGGKDPGSVAGDVLEKNINLQVTCKIRDLLQEQGIRVVLTREEDVFLGLEERVEIANGNGGLLFVSVHCNYFDGAASASGFEIYYYQDPQAKAVASAILADLKATGQVKTRSVKTEEYYVLENTAMPAILMEIGFITDPQECQLLCSDEYQQLLAQSIVSSIVRALQNIE